MEYSAITYSVDDHIARITLNRPEVMNGLSPQMRLEIIDAVKRGEAEARVIVITGAGRGFCSGQDLGQAGSLADNDIERVLREEYEPMLQAIYQCRVPTISAVNGPAAGAGAALALAADVVIASESAFFQMAFARIGLIPDAGATYWLPRQMGFARAMGAALFAEKITAKQAVDWGMIWESASDELFETQVTARATALANGPTKALRYIKKAIREGLDHTLPEQLDVEAALQGKAGASFDFREGVMAFMEKRAPKFEGR